MVYVIILAGGKGTRLGADIPKQYIPIKDKPIIAYLLEKLDKYNCINEIVIVLETEWKDFVSTWLEEIKFTKKVIFASAGTSRQHSILNGLKVIKQNGANDEDIVIIHDAARPNVSEKLMIECVCGLQKADGVMPVLPVKDTIYYSKDGEIIDSLLDRDCLFAGQAPESFRFGKYLNLHKGLNESDLSRIRGSSELAYQAGLNIQLIQGDEHNYKITTASDLDKFIRETI